jgi:hypothetical protein
MPLLGPNGERYHRVWRVKILEQELLSCGLENAKDPWEEVLKPLLIQKGLPEGYTLQGTPARIETEGNDIVLEFE